MKNRETHALGVRLGRYGTCILFKFHEDVGYNLLLSLGVHVCASSINSSSHLGMCHIFLRALPVLDAIAFTLPHYIAKKIVGAIDKTSRDNHVIQS